MLIGLTGNIGSGKSTVLRLFARLGAVTIDSDEIVSGLYAREDIKKKAIQILGNSIVNDNGELNKKKIADLIFNNNMLKCKIEALLHSLVFKEIEDLSSKNPYRLVIAEVPLLFETAYNKRVDHVILLNCSRDIIFDRLRNSGFSENEIKARLSSQMPDEVKRFKADTVIDTGRSIEDIGKDVEVLFNRLTK
ncbi:MAG: dephospho-CoA kinase [Thermodesulfovibrionales bacterium]